MNQTINNRIDQIKKGQVPVGYENTSFGVFPIDWKKNLNLSQLFYVIDGDRGINYPKESEYKIDGFCLFINALNVTKNGFEFKELKFINEDRDKLLHKGKLIRNDIILTTRGTVGNFAYYNQNIKYNHLRINSGMVILRRKNSNDQNFWFSILKSNLINRQIKKICFGSAQPQLTVTSINHLKVFCPESESEKAHIAEILMKWDEAVELQESYIAKLETRKKALMQKLLTPKTEWVKIKLGDSVAIMTSGGTPLTSISNYYDGDIVWVSIDDISSCGKYLNDSSRKITSLGLTNSSAKLFPINTILYAMYASIGKCTIATVECSSSQAILGIVPKSEILDFQFLYYHLCNIQEKMILQGQKGTQANLNKDMVSKFKISIPLDKQKKPNVAEQNHIAKILSSADEEISLQKQKLEKLKEQRKSMQQLLLTGIVRV